MYRTTLPTNPTLEDLRDYLPTSTSKKEFMDQANKLIELNKQTIGVANRTLIVIYLFQLVAVNLYILKDYPRMHQTVINKLNEFRQGDDQYANRVADEFWWLTSPEPKPPRKSSRLLEKRIMAA